MKLSIIIPAFNEENRIITTLNKITKYLHDQPFESEIIVVDDGSIDNTITLVETKNYLNLRVIPQQKNLGKGKTVKTGVKQASGDLVLFMDADYSTTLDELEFFLLKINEGYDIVIGSRALNKSRVLKHQPIWKEWFGKIGNKIIKLTLGLDIQDTQCGFKLFTKQSAQIFNYLTLNRFSFDVELLFIAKKYNYKIAECPVNWTNDNQSKVGLMAYPKFLLDIFCIYFNNLRGIYKV